MGIFDAIASIFSTGAQVKEADATRNQQQNQFVAQENVAVDQFNQQMAFQQQQAAANTIQGKVAQGAAAGISPLASIGVAGFSPSPISVSQPGIPTPPTVDYSGLKSAGASIDDLLAKASSSAVKKDALELQILQNSADKGSIENAMLASDARRTIAAPGAPPSYSGFPPLPRPDPRYTAAVEPGATRFLMLDGSLVARPSQALTSSNFSINPIGPIDAVHQSVNPPIAGPDIWRAIQNLNLPDPSPQNVP